MSIVARHNKHSLSPLHRFGATVQMLCAAQADEEHRRGQTQVQSHQFTHVSAGVCVGVYVSVCVDVHMFRMYECLDATWLYVKYACT